MNFAIIRVNLLSKDQRLKHSYETRVAIANSAIQTLLHRGCKVNRGEWHAHYYLDIFEIKY